MLAAHRGTADAAGIDWKSAIFKKIQEEVTADPRLTIERMVELARLSRASYYRFDENAFTPDKDIELRDAIQRLAIEWPTYGRPRITEELRRRGWLINPKRVHRIMREINLLCVRRRKFVVTTDSEHVRRIYQNLAREMVLTTINQLWVADITYIRLLEEFIFLAVILDAHSRRVIGWALDRTLEDQLTLAALDMAISQREVPPGLVHHSDRGVQYTSNDYFNRLKCKGIAISMSRKGNPWDTAARSHPMRPMRCRSFRARDISDPFRP